jgi:hypothetical protein
MKKYLERKREAPTSAPTKHLIPAWQQGAKAAFILSPGFISGLLPGTVPMGGAEMVGNFAIGIVATFLVWWTACTIVVGFWRVMMHS